MTGRILTPRDFQAAFDVSRETLERLEAYHALLMRWNRRINLVSRGSMAEAWHRHFADSAQLWALRPAGGTLWLDLGSGAGFPGLVIAALAAEQAPGLRVVLVESDARKVAFLDAAAAAAGLSVMLHCTRIETLEPQPADIVSARALAPLDALFAHAEKHLRRPGIGLFPKGGAVHNEIAAAAARWRFDHRIHHSRTDPNAAIVETGAIARV